MIERGDWKSDRDWKTIFGTEAGNSLRKGARLEGVATNVPIFELTCRLLYKEQSNELVSCHSNIIPMFNVWSLCRCTL